MLKNHLFFIVFGFTNQMFAQQTDCQEINPKFEKKFIKALSEKDQVKRMEKLGKLAVDFPDNPKTYFYLAEFNNKDAQSKFTQGNQKEGYSLQKKANLF